MSTVEERSTKTQWQVHSRHVLACDGAKSQVRADLGIESEGEDGCKLHPSSVILLSRLTYLFIYFLPSTFWGRGVLTRTSR